MEQTSALQSNSMGDILIRSRQTILDLLERRGYNVQPYRKLIGPDLLTAATGGALELQAAHLPQLRIDVTHREDSTKHAIVEYMLQPIKQSVSQGTLIRNLLGPPPLGAAPTVLHDISPETTEVIILYFPRSVMEDNDTYDKAALEAWVQKKFKIQFFPIQRLVYNPLNHMLQPQFRVVPEEQVAEILQKNYARSKTQFPFIRFHADMAARCLGLVPGQVVEITRPSPSAGSYVLYRVCTP
jgi:DNA-directed RNA polymerase subunit H (RpoH/RPB5)